jgi:hypothetical protein
MKQRSFFVLLFSAILAFPLLACALVGQARLVVSREAVSQVDETLAQLARDGTFSGSVLIAQDGVVFLNKGMGWRIASRVSPLHPRRAFTSALSPSSSRQWGSSSWSRRAN